MESSGRGGWITVGFDGSPAALSALRWAAALARPTVDHVVLVAVARPDPTAGPRHMSTGEEDRVRAAADAALLDLRASHPSLEVRVSVRTGDVSRQLDRTAPTSSLITLGIRERRLGRPVPGPVARRALRSTGSAVALVPVQPAPRHDVPRVVGAVAGAATRAEVVEAAMRLADRLDAEVQVVRSTVTRGTARPVQRVPFLALVTDRPPHRGRGPASPWERRLARVGCPVVVIAEDDRPLL